MARTQVVPTQGRFLMIASRCFWAKSGVALAALVATTNVFAQGAAPEEASGGVEEIIVTARKVSENIQDTPISITAFSAEGLEARNIGGLAGLSDFTPNLTINTSAAFSGSSQTAAVFIRGIGQTDFTLNTDPGVGTYVDGVYISRSVGGLLDLGDVERVEILRGPQGTLFGKNTIGGAINITTRKPSFETEGNVSALYGSDDWVKLQANLSGPLSETVAAKIFARYERRDGYVLRTTDNIDQGNKNSLDLRAGILFKPSNAVSIQLNGDYTRSRENGAPLVPIAINPNALFVIIHNALVAPGLVPTLGNNAFYTPAYLTTNLYRVQGDYPVYSDADVWGLSANAEFELGGTTLRSITAYRDVSSEFARDGDGSPLPVNATSDVYDYNQFSQEFQLLGKAFGDKLNYILGAYYLQEKGSNLNIVDFGFVELNSGGRVKTKSYAAFAQLGYEITDRFTVTAGIRYTDETRRFTPDQFIKTQRVVLPIPPFPPEAAVLNFPAGTPLVAPGTYSVGSNEWTPMVNLSYKPSENALLYATFSRGFKGAGFTQRVYPPNLELGPMGPTGRILGPPSFGTESVSVYEAGFKFSTPDKRFRLNGAAFYTDYSDLQVTVQIGVAPTTQNAAAATVKGFELEAQFVPVDGLRFDLGAGYTDAQYDQLDARVSGITLASKLPGTSKWTANAAVSYEFDLGTGSLTPRVDWAYRSKFFFDANNAVGENGYGIWNASLTYNTGDKGFAIGAFVKNIGNKTYFTHGESIFDPAGFTSIVPSRKREWGVRVTKSF
jgi:iron complex outermembrane recepter protein